MLCLKFVFQKIPGGGDQEFSLDEYVVMRFHCCRLLLINPEITLT